MTDERLGAKELNAIEARWEVAREWRCTSASLTGTGDDTEVLPCGNCHECTDTPKLVAEVRRLQKREPVCVYCGNAAQGNYSIERDGFGDGPEVPLCDDCGAHPWPTCRDIWAKLERDRRVALGEDGG